MGKETKVGLLVGMCFIVCCAIVLSHHGRRRAEAQSLSVTNAERSRKAPLPLDRNASAEQATKRIAPKRPSHQDARQPNSAQPESNQDESTQYGGDFVSDLSDDQDLRLADSRNADSSRSGSPGGVSHPFIHRGPPIPDVVAPGNPSRDRRNPDDRVILDAGTDDSGPMVANLPSRNRESAMVGGDSRVSRPGADLHRLTSTPSPAPTQMSSRQIEDEFARLNHAPKSTRKAAMDRHVVQNGDHLSRIAQQYYGSDDPEILNAIVKANHETMSSPDHIVVGQELLLPEIPGIEPESNSSPKGNDASSGEWSEIEAADVDPDDRGTSHAQNTHLADTKVTNDQPKIIAEYVVKPGDLLSRIVSRQYGSASKANIDAVFNANRDRMKSPDRLESGTVLRMPEIAGMRADDAAPDNLPESSNRSRPAAGSLEPKATPATTTTRDESAFTWYQVEKGDTYSTIASDKLGTSKRWKELADLNKDIFPNAKQIRHGVRIRIPSSSSSEETRSNRRSH